MVELYEHQVEVLDKIHNGSILCGGVGSGKSITSLAYYYICNGGKIKYRRLYGEMKDPKDLYIITTAMKRDSLEWEEELAKFGLSTDKKANRYSNIVNTLLILDIMYLPNQ